MHLGGGKKEENQQLSNGILPYRWINYETSYMRAPNENGQAYSWIRNLGQRIRGGEHYFFSKCNMYLEII